MSFLEDQVAAARAVPEVRRWPGAATGPPSPLPGAIRSSPRRAAPWAVWLPLECITLPLGAATHCAPSPPLCARTQAERSPEAAAFIEMYELAAEAKAFKDRSPSRPDGADGVEWERFWTGCFLRLARCYLAAPAPLEGGAGALSLEEEAIGQMLGPSRGLYGQGGLRGGGVGGGASRALGRVLENGGFQLGHLARLAVGSLAYDYVPASLCGSVLARLRRPGARARVQAQLAAAQAGAPPARRLTCDQLELLFAKAVALKSPDSPAQRCGANVGFGGAFKCASTKIAADVGLTSCVLTQTAHGLNARNAIASAPHPPRRAAADVLRRLRPDEPVFMLCLSACLAKEDGLVNAVLGATHDAIAAARRKRSPFFEAYAGYLLARTAAAYVGGGARLDAAWARPSALLECLRRAEEARRRCKAVLPTEWVALLAELKASTHALRPWLERCQRSGNRLPVGASPEVAALYINEPSRCSGCGELSSQLRACPCKQAYYCRWAWKAILRACVRACMHAWLFASI
jgi:hypothetical protein